MRYSAWANSCGTPRASSLKSTRCTHLHQTWSGEAALDAEAHRHWSHGEATIARSIEAPEDCRAQHSASELTRTRWRRNVLCGPELMAPLAVDQRSFDGAGAAVISAGEGLDRSLRL